MSTYYKLKLVVGPCTIIRESLKVSDKSLYFKELGVILMDIYVFVVAICS